MILSTSPQLRANFRHLYADIFWFGVLAGSVVSFLAVYASRLGASSFQIGLLSAGPAAVNLLVSLPAGRWMTGRSLFRISTLSALFQRFGYLILIVLPWLFGAHLQIWMVILLSLLMSVPAAILAIAFNALFADVVPPEYRGEVVGRRNALVAVSVTVTSLMCGQLLDRIVFPLNYQIVFAIGALGALLSAYHLGRVRPLAAEAPPRIGRPIGDIASLGALRFMGALRRPIGLRFLTRAKGQSLLRLDLLRGPFGPFMAAYLAFYTFLFFSIPLFPVFYVRELGLSDEAISLGTGLFHAAMLLVSLRLNWLSGRFGHRRILIGGALIFSTYPLLIGLAQDATLFWVASVIGGGIWAMSNGGLVNRLMERVPADDRPAHMALHNLALNLGILAGSLLGPLSGDWLGLRYAILLGAALRLLGGILVWIWG